MALYNPGGEAKPICKYDAKMGVCKIDDREIPLKDFKAIVDFEGLEVGYIHFSDGPPTFNTVPALDHERAAALKRPELLGKDGKPAFKWGYRCCIKLTKELAKSSPSVREFSSNSYLAFNGFDAVTDDWLAERTRHPGQLPVVVGKMAIEVGGGHGKNYQPVYAIAGWVDPPEDLIAMRNGSGNGSAATAKSNDVPAHVGDVEGEPEVLEPVEFADPDDF